MAGARSSQLDSDQGVSSSQKTKKKRKQTLQDAAAEKFKAVEEEDDDAGTEIGFDNGNNLLDDDQVNR